MHHVINQGFLDIVAFHLNVFGSFTQYEFSKIFIGLNLSVCNGVEFAKFFWGSLIQIASDGACNIPIFKK